jgi:hypothetical protein
VFFSQAGYLALKGRNILRIFPKDFVPNGNRRRIFTLIGGFPALLFSQFKMFRVLQSRESFGVC